MEVMSLEDVYWVEDNAVRPTLGKDLQRWIQARQTLPTSKEDLETLKADLWSAVVKNSQHQDAWTWGKLFSFSSDTRKPVRLNGSLEPRAEKRIDKKHPREDYRSDLFLMLRPVRWNVGSFRVGGRVSDPGCYDAALSSTRSKTFPSAIRDRKVFAAEQLPRSLRVGRAAARRRNNDVHCEGTLFSF